MLTIIGFLLIAGSALQPQYAQAEVKPASFPVAEDKPLGRYVTKEWLRVQVASSSRAYGLPSELQAHIADTLWNESHGDTQAVGALGELGLAQVRPEPKYHNISKKEGFDPYWSVDFIVKAVYEGHSSWWSTW